MKAPKRMVKWCFGVGFLYVFMKLAVVVLKWFGDRHVTAMACNLSAALILWMCMACFMQAICNSTCRYYIYIYTFIKLCF